MNMQWKKRLSVLAVAVGMIITTVLTVTAANNTDVTVGEAQSITTGVVSQSYSEIRAYRENGKTAPSAPTGYSNYVFAGWFQCEQCGNEEGHKDANHDYLDCPIATTTTSGEAYAKFVIKDVMGVKAQFLAGTSFASEESDMRFVTTVDSLDYEEVGFKCVQNGVTKSAKSDTVYKKLYASFTKDDGSTMISTLLPTAFSETTSKYFMAGILRDIPNADFGDAIKVTPYWITLDGTTVEGDSVVKTVNNGYVDITTGVTVQATPVIDYSSDYTQHISDTTLTYWPQGGCVGVDNGVTYYYQAMVSTDNTVSYILKINVQTGKIVKCSANLQLGHTNDITYNKNLGNGMLVVCQNSPNNERISFVDPSTLEVVNPNDVNLTFGEGVTVKNTYITTSHKEVKSFWGYSWTETITNKLYSIEYNSYQQKYVVGISGGQSFRILNADFSDTNETGAAFSPTENTSGFTTQNVVADDSYIYFVLYHDGEVDNTSYKGHVIAVYDWDGNYVTVLEIPTSSISQSIEPENMAIYNNQMYISCGNKKIYKVADFDISEAEFEARIEDYYYETLEDAVDAVQEGQTIIITSPNVSVSEKLEINQANVTITNEAGINVTVKKGADFSGNLISNNADGLKIQGAETGSLTFAGNGYSGSSLVAVEKQLTIEKVNFKNLEANYNGGAVNVRENATVTIKKCNFDNNTAGEQGGAIYVSTGATATVENSTFTGNKTINYSGGAIRSDGALTVTDSTFLKNESKTVGGAIIGDGVGSSLTLTDCKFDSNISNGNGGAVQATTGCTATLNVTESGKGTFLNNSANGTGGAIHTNNSALAVTGYEFLGNTATSHGGAINIGGSNEHEGVSDQTICLVNNTFASNTAKGNGGAVYNAARTIEISDCVFGQEVENDGETVLYGNTAKFQGGAVWTASAATVTIEGSQFTGNKTEEESGGAIRNNGTLTVSNSDFTKNSSGSVGGAIIVDGADSELTLTDCDFTANSATNGGAVQVTGGAVATLNKSQDGGGTFTGNTSSNAGAAIFMNDSALTIEGYTFEGNKATGNGGAIYINNGTGSTETVVLNNSTFLSNESGNVGGAIGNIGRNVSITSCIFGEAEKGNKAEGFGGAFYAEEAATLTFTGTTFTANESETQGGAIRLNHTKIDATLENCTFDSNKAKFGGALMTTVKDVTIKGSKFVSNESTSVGGAIYGATGNLTVTSCQFGETDKGNKATTGGAIYYEGGAKVTFNKSNDYNTEAIFEENSATTTGGGAIYFVNACTLDVDDYTFTGNTAPAGGAIYLPNKNISVTIDGSTFTSNETTTGNGGAIYNNSSASLNITGGTFGTNNAYDAGGALWFSSTAKGTINSVNFTGNSTSAGSGGAIRNEGTLTVTNSDFTSNSAGTVGGAVIGDGASSNLTLTDCDFASNSSKSNGGAVQVTGGSVATLNKSENGGGTFTSNSATGIGGAIYTNASTLTVNGYVFDGNTATNHGGAICINSGAGSTETIALENNKFISNVSGGCGGAVFNTKRSINITSCDFGETGKGNTATSYGGAFYTDGAGAVSVTDTTFTDNDATGFGGAIYSGVSSTVNLLRTTFTGNESSSKGGAYYADASGTGTVTVTDSTFTSNTASDFGGALYSKVSSTLNLTGTTFTGNESTTQGGAIRLENTSVEATLEDCTFTSNKAQFGGALMTTVKGVTLKGSKFVSNESTSVGGAIYGATGNLTVTSCQFGETDKGNKATTGGAIYYEGGAKVTLNKSANYSTDAIFKENSATETGGGAIYLSANCTLDVDDYAFTGNTAPAGGAIYLPNKNIPVTIDGSIFTSNNSTSKNGGAIYNNSSAQVNITGGEFSSNTAYDAGGALWYSSTAKGTINSVNFTGNSTSAGSGGAIRNEGTLTVTKSDFTSNRAGTVGGAVIGDGASSNLTLTDCDFASNSSKSNGGAVQVTGGSVATLNKSENGGGTFTSNSATGIGGAIYTNASTLTVNGYVFDGNTATNHGGAICINSGAGSTETISLESNKFINNVSGGCGGAVFNTVRNISITSCDFGEEGKGNTATKQGGAFYADGAGTVNITDTTFTDNTASDWGGAILSAVTSTLKLTRTTFTGNESTSQGGAIRLGSTSTVVTVEDCTFDSNTAPNGGAILSVAKSITFDGSKFVSNTTAGSGGAIYGALGTMTFTSCDFGEAGKGNQANNGGAIYIETKTSIPVTITGSTFTSNKGTTKGGAIFNGSTNATTGLNIVDTDFSSNTSKNGGAIYSESNGSVGTVSISGGSTFTDNKSDYSGGAIRLQSGAALNVSDSTFKGNWSYMENGGAIYTASNSATITSCTFGGDQEADGNQANGTSGSTGAGGAICAGGTCALTVKSSTFKNNIGKGAGGGAIYSGSSAALTIEDSLFTSNTAKKYGAGAVRVIGGSLTISGGAFINNSTDEVGGAIQTTVTTNITNCGFTGNTARQGANTIWKSAAVTLDGCTALNASDLGGTGSITQTNTK